MSQVIKTIDGKNLLIVTDGEEENASSLPLNNPTPKILATSNGSLVRVLGDVGRLEFIPIHLNGGQVTPGNQETKTHDVLTFEEPQQWVVLSHFTSLYVE